MKQPDIVLLVLDTQRADHLSCYGYHRETSPYLDKLATEATTFTHAIAPAQWTLPSHASMFTGLYPSQHTMFEFNSILPPNLPTLAERLQAAGYFTAAFSNNPLIGPDVNGMRRGFKICINHRYDYGGLLSLAANLSKDEHIQPKNEGLALKKKVANVSRHLQDKLAKSNTVSRFMRSPLIKPLWDWASQRVRISETYTRPALESAARQLIERPGVALGQPVFIFINLMGVHIPYQPPQWAIERFMPRPLQGQATKTYQHYINAFLRKQLVQLLPPHTFSSKEKTILNALYDAEIASQDALIGLFLQKLRQANRLDQTFLMVAADHGDHLGEKNMIGHSFGAYQELCHVPLIIRDPSGDIAARTTIATPCTTRRLFHTALTVAGTATPGEEDLSLTKLSSPKTTFAQENLVFVEAKPPLSALERARKQQSHVLQIYDDGEICRAVYQFPYKLIQFGRQGIKLYNIEDDPQEKHDLLQTLPQVATHLHHQLHTFIQQTQAQAKAVHSNLAEDDPLLVERLRNLGYLE